VITEITSVIAIVLSVAYLALQIRDNTKVLRSQAHYNALSLAQRPMEMMIENDGLATVVNGGYATPDALSADDWARFGNYMFIGFNAWEYLYYQNKDHSIPGELWVGADAYFKDLVEAKPGLRRFWSEFEASFAEPFRSYVAAEFARRPAPARSAREASDDARSLADQGRP
jgi:hypothetical protein